MRPSVSQAEREVARVLERAAHVAVLTGAGVSAESGISTFRSTATTMSALWKDFDPQTLATPEAFEADPERVTRWYDWRRLGCLSAEPNPGHLAIARLQSILRARGGDVVVLTQNVDRLHHKAGTLDVVELHGNIISWRCTRTGRGVELPPIPLDQFPAPSPHHPQGLLRPDVVWFGEALPAGAVRAAEEAVGVCDVFMVVGTSSQVYPAAGFVHAARARGATTVEINPESTSISDLVTYSIRGPSGQVLPRVVEWMNNPPAA